MKSWSSKIKGLVFLSIILLSAFLICKNIYFAEVKTDTNEPITMHAVTSEKERSAVGNTSKMVTFTVENVGRANPFLPPSEEFTNMKQYDFDLVAPPETIADEEADAVKVVATKVSGIMYDEKNPSAILNIEGEDYLVKTGDNINNYRILSISKDIVTVQLGMNVHKARVGEIISDATVNHNNVYDLHNKFGGAKR